MPTFQSNPFRSARSQANSLGERIAALYRRKVATQPFLYFGLPFIALVVSASFLLTPAAALRYERHDRKTQTLTHSEAMTLGLKGGAQGEGGVSYNPRKRRLLQGNPNQERDEYYRLMAKDLDDWEQKRVKRWKGEPDGRIE